jgi:hypothetical protein
MTARTSWPTSAPAITARCDSRFDRFPTSLPSTTLDLSYMELGEEPGRGPSWLARVLALRDNPDLGLFRLALLEALMKAADERASGGAA